MEQLREVAFTIEKFEGSFGDYYSAGENPEEICKERMGYFHQWGTELIYSPNAERYLPQTVGIVEEKETGRIYHVIPKFLTFKH